MFLALVLVVGVLVAIVGECISAAGAPEIGVVDTWGRIDEAVNQIAAWPYLIAAGAGAILLLGGRARETSKAMRVAWVGVILMLVAIAIAAKVGIVALFKRVSNADAVGGVGTSDYYSETERIGEAIVYAAIVLVVAGLLLRVIRAQRTRGSLEP